VAEFSPARSPKRIGHVVGFDRERAFVVVHDEIDRSLLLELMERHPGTDGTILRHLNVCRSEVDPDPIVFGGHVSGCPKLA